MSKQIKQIIRPYDGDEAHNIESLENFVEVLNGEQVSMLGIQATPGTQIQINGGSTIQVGAFGVYELDLTRFGGSISELKIKRPDSYPSGSGVIIDILYEMKREDQ